MRTSGMLVLANSSKEVRPSRGLHWPEEA